MHILLAWMLLIISKKHHAARHFKPVLTGIFKKVEMTKVGGGR